MCTAERTYMADILQITEKFTDQHEQLVLLRKVLFSEKNARNYTKVPTCWWPVWSQGLVTWLAGQLSCVQHSGNTWQGSSCEQLEQVMSNQITWTITLPEQPEQVMSNLLVVDSSLQQKLNQFTLKVWLVLESLDELQQVLEQLRVTAADNHTYNYWIQAYSNFTYQTFSKHHCDVIATTDVAWYTVMSLMCRCVNGHLPHYHNCLHES